MFERFTDPSRQVLVLASKESRILGHGFIGTEHLLLAMIITESPTSTLLCELGVTHEFTRNRVLEIIGQGSGSIPSHLPFTPNAKNTLEFSLREVLALGHQWIHPEHLLLSMTGRLSSELNATAMQILLSVPGMNLDELRAKTIEAVNESAKDDPDPNAKPASNTGAAPPVDPDIKAFTDWYTSHGSKRFGPSHPVSKLFKRLG